MKISIIIALVFCSALAFGQTQVVVQTKIVKGSDLQKAGFPKEMFSITDNTIYDQDGNVIDSATARAKERTFDYTLGFGKAKGQTGVKRMLFKVDTARQTMTDNMIKMSLRPTSPKLWQNAVIDLSPLAKRTDVTQLEGKAVVLIFWRAHPGIRYDRVNEVIADYINSNRFKVFAITHEPYEVAALAFKKDPILNATKVFDAPSIVDFYETGNKPVIVVTNAQHQITFAISEYAALTPRTLNKLLKAL